MIQALATLPGVQLIQDDADWRLFAQVPAEHKAEFEYWCEALASLVQQPGRLSQNIQMLAEAHGVSDRTVRRKLDAWRARDWRRLIDRRCKSIFWAGRGQDRAQVAREIWKTYCEDNKRGDGSRAAWKRMCRDWREGRIVIPLPVSRRTGLPQGCTYANLMKPGNRPDAYELAAARRGRAAAAAHRPLTFTTRKGAYVGSHYLLDDKWHDYFVNSFAERQAGRPLEMALQDYYSAFKPFWGIRIRTRRDDGTHQQIGERMTRLVLAGQLWRHGYSPRGTTIVSEAGTGVVRDDVASALFKRTGGLITVCQGAVRSDAGHIGLYPAVGRGNFRHKASLESNHRLEHTTGGHLPGQAGRNLVERPEGLARQLEHNALLLRVRDQLPEIVRDQLQFDLLELNQFMVAIAQVYDAIADDPLHDLEGWVECGHTINEIELAPGVWRDVRVLDDLPEERRTVILSLLEAGALPTRPRRMTRREVYTAGAGDLVRLPGDGVVAILGQDLAREARVDGGLFEFEDAELGPGLHRYDSVVRDGFGRLIPLVDRETYQVFPNPFAPEVLFVTDARGSYIGEARRWHVASHVDTDAVKRAMGASAHREVEMARALNARHAPEAAARAARAANNAALIDQHLGGPAQRAAARRVESAARTGATNLTSDDKAAITSRDDCIGDYSPPPKFSSAEISEIFRDDTP